MESLPMLDEPQVEDMRVLAYAFKGRLCVLGIANTDIGPIPLSTHVPISGECPDGPVGEDSPPNVQEAFQKAHVRVSHRLQVESMKAAAESLVLRAREGDQNAMGMMMEIRKASQDPEHPAHDRAKVAFGCLLEFAQGHPVQQFGEDTPDEPKQLPVSRERKSLIPSPVRVLQVICANIIPDEPVRYPIALAACLPSAPPGIETVVMLANGPPLLRPLVEQISSFLDEGPESKTFMFGVVHCMNRSRLRAMFSKLPPHGRRILHAGRVIGVARRMQGIRYGQPLSSFSPEVAWELGE